jgi:hypothetical protein
MPQRPNTIARPGRPVDYHSSAILGTTSTSLFGETSTTNTSSSNNSRDTTPLSLLSNRPTSLLAASLPQYSASLTTSIATRASSATPPRPRRLWAVNDTSLRPIPKFYPPLDPRCTTFVSDSSPSVVAVRISECLRKRSIAVEYDEEAVRIYISV